MKASRRGRVLIVDDERIVGEALALYLRDEHDVTVITQARYALTLLEAGDPFDVILCDVRMPRMGGVDFHRALAARSPEQAARVLFISGGVTVESDRLYIERLAITCLEKPPDPYALRLIVRKRVESTGARDALGG